MNINIDFTERYVYKLIREQIKSPIAIHLGLEIRRYQVVAAINSFDCMIKGKNVVLNLPTGTGKTMVANILSLILLESHPESRCLYLAPSRSLVYQHRYYSRWLAPKLQSCLLNEMSSSPPHIIAYTKRSQIIISTPQLFANMVRSGLISKDILNSLCMVSIDEFDDHFVFGYTDEGPSARFDSQFQAFNSIIPHDIPVQLISATDPKVLINHGNKDPEIEAFSKLMDKNYSPEIIDISPKLYFNFIPTANVEPIFVIDKRVFYISWAISVEMALVFDKIFEETGLLISRDDVLSKLEAILCHTVTHIRLINGTSIPVSNIDYQYFSSLRNLLNCHEHLYEDMSNDLEYEIRLTRIFSIQSNDFVMIELPRLIDNRTIKEFTVRLQNKLNALISILEIQKGHTGVIFTRKIRLSDALFEYVNTNGWNAIQVDSRLNDKLREVNLTGFRENKYNLLLITRKTGRRGLDLPQADFSIFYSPKSRETTTWQELSRIRSNVHQTKSSYFLSYSETADSRRMDTLLEKMKASGREYLIGEGTIFGEEPSTLTNSLFSKISGISENMI